MVCTTAQTLRNLFQNPLVNETPDFWARRGRWAENTEA